MCCASALPQSLRTVPGSHSGRGFDGGRPPLSSTLRPPAGELFCDIWVEAGWAPDRRVPQPPWLTDHLCRLLLSGQSRQPFGSSSRRPDWRSLPSEQFRLVC